MVVAGGRHAHRFDCGRDDVKNNERGRGQERGCDSTLTRNARNGASLLSLDIHIVYLYSMFSIALVRRSVRRLHSRFVLFSGSQKTTKYLLSVVNTSDVILITYLINKILAQCYYNDITNNNFKI